MKIKLNLARLTVPQLLVFSQEVNNKMMGNAWFTTPNPSLATLGSQYSAANSAATTAEAAQQTAVQRTLERDNQVLVLENMLNQLAAYVENVTGGDTAKILSAGFAVRSAGGPVGQLPAPENMGAAVGSDAGQFMASWDRVPKANSYEVATCADPVNENGWAHRGSVTRTKFQITGATSGVRCWVRVRAINSAGPSEWSEPAVVMVP